MGMPRKVMQYVQTDKQVAGRQELSERLNPEGQLFVDYVAGKLMLAMKQKGRAPLSEVGARELALAVLQHCWDGRLPEMYPVLVEVGLDTALENAPTRPTLEVESCSQE